MTALSCQPCAGHTWPARNAGCECIVACGVPACTGSPRIICGPERITSARPGTYIRSPIEPVDRLSVSDAAFMAGLSLPELRDLASAGTGPARYGTASHSYYARAEFEAWVAGWSA